ncbi:hypothetical protein [Burkholderia vietnamiensis]|uniref:hypothetical protein n=1 Tax=Burkholderia vietnamiensis TaxID=60552 RepID=UPI00158BA2F2|nr:hypothetical protein [Burkholderia vietnamiensis]
MKNWIVSLIAFMAMMFVGWYGGADYLTRGGDQAFWVSGALSASVWLFLYRKVATGQRISRLPLRVNRILWTVAVFVFVLVDGWYAGTDLGVRGAGAAGLLMLATAFGGLTWFCPVWVPVGLATIRPSESRLRKM